MKVFRLWLLGAALWLSVPAFAGPLSLTAEAPVIHVRLDGPDGVRFVLFEGKDRHELKAQSVVALRPGYIYRFAVTDFPELPGVTLYPSLEVHGTLALPPEERGDKSPVPLYFDVRDVARVSDGTLITKVAYLEDPRRAVPRPQRPREPFEEVVPPTADMFEEATERGRPILVVRIGDRSYSDMELAQQSIPGTVRMPGEEKLALPPVAPPLKWLKFPLYDRTLGSRELEGECLIDGGDRKIPVGYTRDGELGGLDPEDTVAEYKDALGKPRIAISNRVCLCAPRFGFLRKETPLIRLTGLNRPQIGNLAQGPALIKERIPSLTAHQYEELKAMIGRRSPTEMQGLVTAQVVGVVVGLDVVDGITPVHDLTGICKAPRGVAKPLILKKFADKKCAEIGEVVNFTIRFSNPGDQPIADVVVSDSLTGRLEYVPGSAKSSRYAIFTTKPNEAGSSILRWELPGTLQGGESGILTFKVRVR